MSGEHKKGPSKALQGGVSLRNDNNEMSSFISRMAKIFQQIKSRLAACCFLLVNMNYGNDYECLGTALSLGTGFDEQSAEASTLSDVRVRFQKSLSWVNSRAWNLQTEMNIAPTFCHQIFSQEFLMFVRFLNFRFHFRASFAFRSILLCSPPHVWIPFRPSALQAVMRL